MRWFISADESKIYFRYVEAFDEKYNVFTGQHTAHNTRYGGQRYTWSETRIGNPPMHTYVSIRQLDDMTVTLHCSITVPPPITPVTDFWEVLHSFDNQYLWKNFTCDRDGKWIHQGLLLGSLVIVHDGSYMPEVAKYMCSAAFMILCTYSDKCAKGVVAERSMGADNYRGEILGGIMVKLVIRAASQRRHSPYTPVRIDCDNMGVVIHGNVPKRKLKEK
jgi:hypothetical protein